MRQMHVEQQAAIRERNHVIFLLDIQHPEPIFSAKLYFSNLQFMRSCLVKEKRYYQRYAINYKTGDPAKFEINIDGVPVHLVNFSLGGLCFLSEKDYLPGDIVAVSANLEHGEINLVGKVIRVTKAGKKLSVAIDLSHSYKLDTLSKL